MRSTVYTLNTLLQKWALSSFVIGGACMATNAYASLGGESSGGGDAVYTDDGDLVLRDFMEDADFVLDNPEFLKSVEGFRDLLGDIAAVNSHFAIEIWKDLSAAKIFTSDKEIPLLDPRQTGIPNEIQAEEQIAVRSGSSILISGPAFEKLGDQKPYLLLHESLHALMPGEGSMHHVKVRTLIKYVRENRSHLDKVAFNKILEKLGVDQAHISPANEIQPLSDLAIDVGRVLLREEGSLSARCAIVQDLVMTDNMQLGTYSFSKNTRSRLQEILLMSESYSQCQTTTNYTLLNRIFPELRTYSSKERVGRMIQSSLVVLPVSIDTDQRGRTYALSTCNNYINASTRNKILSAKSDWSKNAQLWNKMKSYSNPQNPAEEVYVRTLVQPQAQLERDIDIFYLGNLFEPEVKLQISPALITPPTRSEQSFEALRRTCAQLFSGGVQQGWTLKGKGR